MATEIKEQASGQPLDPRGGYAHAGEFLKDVWRAAKPGGKMPGQLDAWMKAVKTAGHMAEGDDSQGGFLVPTQFVADLKMQEGLDDGIPGRCFHLPAERSSVSIPYVNDVSHTGGVYGGVIVKRTGEGAQKLYSKPTLGLCTLTLHKLIALTYASEELIEDSPASIAAMFGKMFPEALNHVVAGDIVEGTGAGMGLGILNAPATIAVARTGAGAIVWADIANMTERLHPRCFKNAVWLANSDTIPDLKTMFQVAIAGQAAVPVYQPANASSGSPYPTLDGSPVIFTEHCPALGDTGDIILADLSQMLLARKGPKVESSAHLRYDYNEQTFRGVVRYDCQPWWPAPVTPKHGTQTLSPFVILNAYPTTTTTSAATTTTTAPTTTTSVPTTTTSAPTTTTSAATTTTTAPTTTTSAPTTTTSAPTTTTKAATTTTTAATTTTTAPTTTTSAATTTTSAPTTTTSAPTTTTSAPTTTTSAPTTTTSAPTTTTSAPTTTTTAATTTTTAATTTTTAPTTTTSAPTTTTTAPATTTAAATTTTSAPVTTTT